MENNIELIADNETGEYQMDRVKVIFRKDRNENDIIAFFPETRVNYGNIMSFQLIGGHSEASYGYYLTTKKAKEEEYFPLLKLLENVYDDCQLVVKQRIYYDDLLNAWR